MNRLLCALVACGAILGGDPSHTGGSLVWKDYNPHYSAGQVVFTNGPSRYVMSRDGTNMIEVPIEETTNTWLFDQRRGSLWINPDYPREQALLSNRWTYDDGMRRDSAGITNYVLLPSNPAGPVGLPLQVLDRWVTTNVVRPGMVIPAKTRLYLLIDSFTSPKPYPEIVTTNAIWVDPFTQIATNYSVGFRDGTNAVELWRTGK